MDCGFDFCDIPRETLKIPSDQLCNLDPSDLQQIKYLTLEGDTVPEKFLPTLRKMSNLQELFLTHCNLKSLDILNQIYVPTLHLEHNAISENALQEFMLKSKDREKPISLTLFPQNTKIGETIQSTVITVFEDLGIYLPGCRKELIDAIEKTESFDNTFLESLLERIKVKDKPEELFGLILKRFFEVVDVLGDGNCLFYSLSLHCEKDATELRKQTVAYIRGHEAEFIPYLMESVEEHCKKMEINKTWGGDIEMLAASRVLDRPIALFHRDYQLKLKGNTLSPICDRIGEDNGEEPLYIWHVKENHFVALLKKDDKDLPLIDWVIP